MITCTLFALEQACGSEAGRQPGDDVARRYCGGITACWFNTQRLNGTGGGTAARMRTVARTILLPFLLSGACRVYLPPRRLHHGRLSTAGRLLPVASPVARASFWFAGCVLFLQVGPRNLRSSFASGCGAAAGWRSCARMKNLPAGCEHALHSDDAVACCYAFSPLLLHTLSSPLLISRLSNRGAGAWLEQAWLSCDDSRAHAFSARMRTVRRAGGAERRFNAFYARICSGLLRA